MVSHRLAKPSNRNVVGVRFSHSPLSRKGESQFAAFNNLARVHTSCGLTAISSIR